MSNSFYLKSFFKVFAVLLLAYFFMLSNFWWGNHDWDFLKRGVELSDGFFEGRFSQHVFSYFLFEGQILPVLTYVCTFGALCAMAFVLALYMEIPQKMWMWFALFIGLNPHTFVLFYYVYLSFPFVCWAGLAVGVLFWTEKKRNWVVFFSGIVFYVFLLGSYPPNLNFILTVFLARRLLMIESGKQTFYQGFLIACFVAGQFLCAYLGYKVIFSFLLRSGYLNGQWYNLRLRELNEMIKAIPLELWQSVRQMFSFYPFMDVVYCFPLALGCGVAICLCLKKSDNKGIAFLGVLMILLATRFSFIVSASSYIAVFRCEYWGKLGLYAFAFSVLSRAEKCVIKNFLFVLGGACFFIFIRADCEIQKVSYLGFKGGRLFHTRLLERITQNENFDIEKKYMTIVFGQPNFSLRYYDLNYAVSEGELVGTLSLPFQLVEILFWEEMHNPVDLRAGIWDSLLYTLGNKAERYKNLPLNVQAMRYWGYMEAKTFPNLSSVYVDDRFILLDLDELFFLRHREMAFNWIDK